MIASFGIYSNDCIVLAFTQIIDSTFIPVNETSFKKIFPLEISTCGNKVKNQDLENDWDSVGNKNWVGDLQTQAGRNFLIGWKKSLLKIGKHGRS